MRIPFKNCEPLPAVKRPSSLHIIIMAVFVLAGCNGNGGSSQPAATTSAGIVHFVPNSHAFWSNPTNWTTSFGPAYADITLASSNFVPCRGGPFALRYYSGPSSGAEDLSCTLTADGNYANCQCFDIPYGVYFVDINAILNHAVYEKTIAQCGADGSLCATLNSAPVCANVNQGNLMPGSSVYSTFSFDCVPENGLGLTDCAQQPYAGCMTAPCFKTGQAGIVNCSCPVFNGPYQVGQNDQACTLGDNLVWSAAYAPPAATPTATPLPAGASANSNARADAVPAVPSPPACLPDAPGGFGCPLYVSGVTMIPADSGVDCAKVCDEYHSCLQPKGAQAGFTCDATLCTDECNDRDLVSVACSGLAGCDISEIVKAETAADCSCCASQLCDCDPSAKTNKAITALNQQQRDRGISPQCDINGTLCGAK
jgi:hypothetical protein